MKIQSTSFVFLAAILVASVQVDSARIRRQGFSFPDFNQGFPNLGGFPGSGGNQGGFFGAGGNQGRFPGAGGNQGGFQGQSGNNQGGFQPQSGNNQGGFQPQSGNNQGGFQGQPGGGNINIGQTTARPIDLTSNQQPAVRTSSTRGTTRSPYVQRCSEECITETPGQYDPVCGTDNQSYHNSQRLECTARCGVNVSQRSRGTCGQAGRQ